MLIWMLILILILFCVDSGGEVVVKECDKVTFPLQCNLTEAFSDVEDTYYVSVIAALGNRTSPSSFCDPFKPIYNSKRETISCDFYLDYFYL